jgi:CDP-glucose 4,6-dehydratase
VEDLAMIRPEAWRGTRVFLTGHTGFKGAWLALVLRRLGAEVTGYALPAAADDLFSVARVGDDMTASHLADVRDLERLRAAVREARPDVVFHLAAQALVRAGYQDPVGTYATNVMGTVNLLEAARTVPELRAVVLVTSDKCYENHGWPWGYRESDAMGGHDPYSSSKGCAELVGAAYARSFFPPERGVGIATARAGNVIGGGDWAADRLVPDLIRGLDSGTPVAIRNPAACRPWQHVLEPLAGYLMLAERLLEPDGGESGGGWNFGPGAEAEQPVRSVAEKVCALWGNPAGWRATPDPGAPSEATVLRLDTGKARSQLGWTPRWSLDQALAATVEWYQSRHREDPRALTGRQIDAYFGS